MGCILKNRSGSLLVDASITMLILFIALALLMQFSFNSVIATKEARYRKVAFLSAEKKINELSIQPCLVNGNDHDVTDNISLYRSWTVSTNSFVKKITVVVTYPSYKMNRQITLTGTIK